MPRHLGMLNSRRVATAKPKRGRTSLVIADGANLYLSATLADDGVTVRRSWTFRYGINGRRREMGLGPTYTLSLAEARDKARDLRKQLLDGIDPLEARESAKQAKLAEAAKAMTFAQCADAYVALHERGWSAEHRRQWGSSLRVHVLPQIGSLPVRDIDQAIVMKVVEPLWQTRTVTAGRILSRIRVVLDYATAHRFREGDNPAGSILSALPKQSRIAKVEHLAGLPWQEIPAFMAELRALQSVPAKCCEFLILTAARSGEAINATWKECDLKARTWTIPAERMKARKAHRVPLSARALEILGPKGDPDSLVFGVNGKPLQETALRRMVLAKLRPNGKKRQSSITTHGFRSAFKTWSSEATAFPRDVVEVALAHKRGGKVEESYQRGDLFEKRRRLMDAWARFCAEGVPAAAEVVPLRGARHA